MPDLSGTTIDRYHLIEKLGEGGMAVVYKAYDTRLECEVALKIIRIERLSPEILEKSLKRFEREAKSVARLTHANIVKVTDYGEYAGSPYLVMPYLPGGTLKELIKQRGQIPWQEAAQLLIPIAEALDYAHAHNVIHRDIKPSNILLTENGTPMLTDFGVAKIIEEEGTQDLTGTSATVGTPEYMAPEQIVSKTVDHRADIYALGVVFYELITGRRPYEADTPMAVLVKHAHDPLPNPNQYVKDLPDDVEHFLFKALTKKPEDRYQNAGDVETALKTLLKNSENAVFTPKPARKSVVNGTCSKPKDIQKTQKKPGILRWVLGGVGVVALVGLGYLLSRLGGGGLDSSSPESTKIVDRTNTPMLEITETLSPTHTLQPLPTFTATITPEPTYASTPELIGFEGKLNSNVKCRTGPDQYLFPYHSVVPAQEIYLIGRNEKGTWVNFIVKEDSSNCWTIIENIDSQGSFSELPNLPDPEIPYTVFYGVAISSCWSETGWLGEQCEIKPKCYLELWIRATSPERAHIEFLTRYSSYLDKYKFLYAVPYTDEGLGGHALSFEIGCP